MSHQHQPEAGRTLVLAAETSADTRGDDEMATTQRVTRATMLTVGRGAAARERRACQQRKGVSRV